MSGETISVIVQNESGSISKIFTIRGIMDAVTSLQVDNHLLPIINEGISDIVLDLSGLKYVSSAGIMCLIRYHVLLKNKQKKMRLVKPPEPVYHTLQVAGILKYFDIYDNVQAALAALRSSIASTVCPR